MSAVPTSTLSVSSDTQGVNTHGGHHSAAGRDIHMHFSNTENSLSITSDQPGTSALQPISAFRSPDVSRLFRTRSLDIDIINIVEADCSSSLNQSSSAASRVSEMYQRLMLKHGIGYPLYHPDPKSDLPIEYRRKGIRIGDVGRVTPDGAFDFLFNVVSSHASSVNPPTLPRGFETVPPVEILPRDSFQSGQHLLSDHVQQVQVMPIRYRFSAREGSVLQLPEGAVLFEAANADAFSDLARRHARNWYEYMYTRRSRDIPNGSLYIVTGCIKTRNWGIGTLHGCPSDHDFLEFISEGQQTNRTYGWRQSGPITTKVGPSSTNTIVTGSEEPNQSVFIRGYKIALGKGLWKKMTEAVSVSSKQGSFNSPASFADGYEHRSGLRNQSTSSKRSVCSDSGHLTRRWDVRLPGKRLWKKLRKAISVSSTQGGSYNSPASFPAGYEHRSVLGNQSTSSRRSAGSGSGQLTHSGIVEDCVGHGELDRSLDNLRISDESDGGSESIVIEPIPSATSPVHPSDIIISILTHLEPEAEVALVHDSEWCYLLPENFAVDDQNLNIRGLIENVAKLCLVALDQNGTVSLVRKFPTDLTKGHPHNKLELDHTSEIIVANKKTAAEASVMPVESGYPLRHYSTAPTLSNRSNAIITASRQSFPNETIEEILNHLDFPNMLRCRAVCSAFRELIDESPYFHWKRELAISGMEDGGNYPLDSRRQMLRQHQQGWANLQWRREQRRNYMNGAWEVKANMLAQTDQKKTMMYLDQLASPSRKIEGRSWTVNIMPTNLHFFTIDPAQNLLVIFERPFEQQNQYIRHIFLWTLSTGSPHPLARGTHVLVHTSMCQQRIQGRGYGYTICGAYLYVLFDDFPETETEIKLWNWKTGQVVANITSNHIRNLTFLSERHIILTIDHEQRLIVIDFIAEPPEKQKLGDVKNAYTFGFPPLVEAAEMFAIYIQSKPVPNWEPDPALHAPFFTACHGQIYTIRLCITDARNDERRFQIISPRSTFLSLIESASHLNTTHFDWPTWGPEGTRIIPTSFGILYNAHGMRLVSTQRPEGQTTNYVYTYDFNQLALEWSRKNGNGAAESGIDGDIGWFTHEGKEGESPEYINVTEPANIAQGGVFKNDVETRLGYRMNRWPIPEHGGPRVQWALCEEYGIILGRGNSDLEEFHVLTL